MGFSRLFENFEREGTMMEVHADCAQPQVKRLLFRRNMHLRLLRKVRFSSTCKITFNITPLICLYLRSGMKDAALIHICETESFHL